MVVDGRRAETTGNLGSSEDESFGEESEEGREGGSRVGIVGWCDDAGGVSDGEPVQSQGGRGLAWQFLKARC